MLKIAPALALVALALPASASAQATRTFVSGVGNDANPCSRTAPCKTFAGAQSLTAAGGIINCLDPGGYGAVTIVKSLTIKCQYTMAGLLASGGINAININAGVNDKVTLRGLDIEGNGTTLGLNGVNIIQARSVKIVDSEIYTFSRSGILLVPGAGVTTRLVVDRTHIHDNGGAGIMAAPANTGVARVTVRDSEIDENGCGLVAAQFGVTNVFSTNCGTTAPNANVGTVAINAIGNGIADSNTSAVLANGSATTVRIGQNIITGSLGPALSAINSGSILTWNNNHVAGNPGGNGATTGSITFLKRAQKRRAIRRCAQRRAQRVGGQAKRHRKWCAKRYARRHV